MGAIAFKVPKTLRARIREYSPDQPRDDQGRWVGAGGAGSHDVTDGGSKTFPDGRVVKFLLVKPGGNLNTDKLTSENFPDSDNVITRISYDVDRNEWLVPDGDFTLVDHADIIPLDKNPDTHTVRGMLDLKTGDLTIYDLGDEAEYIAMMDKPTPTRIDIDRVRHIVARNQEQALSRVFTVNGKKLTVDVVPVAQMIGESLREYSPDQPRDEQGKWTDGTLAQYHSQDLTKDFKQTAPQGYAQNPKVEVRAEPGDRKLIVTGFKNANHAVAFEELASKRGFNTQWVPAWRRTHAVVIWEKRAGEIVREYSPDQPRDEHGRWTAGGDLAVARNKWLAALPKNVRQHFEGDSSTHLNVEAVARIQINAELLGKRGPMPNDVYPEWKSVFDRIHTALELATTTHAATLEHDVATYRGVSAREFRSMSKKETFTSPTYEFLTANRGMAEKYAKRGGQVMTVHLPAGTKVAFGWEDQHELILPRNSSFAVKGTSMQLKPIKESKALITDHGVILREYDPDQPRDYHGRWTADGDGDIVHTDDVDVALKALADGKRVEFSQPRTVSTLLNRLSDIAKDAASKGPNAPKYDLCKVSVAGTNLFCAETMGIPRLAMPQLSGKPLPGSPADALPRDQFGQVNIAPRFVEYLRDQGVNMRYDTEGAEYLKATQRELIGVKVGQMVNAIRTGTVGGATMGPLIVNRDNYIVDGHHRWAATVGLEYERPGRQYPMRIIRVDMGIIELVAQARKFAAQQGLPSVGGGLKIGEAMLMEYSPDQPRDEQGRWTDTGAGGLPPLGGYAKRPNSAPASAREREGTGPMPGLCYEAAARYAVLDVRLRKDVTVVHGTITVRDPATNTPFIMGHAWVELPGNRVYDGADGRFYDKDDYYQKLSAKVERAYSAANAARLMFRHETFGPWHQTAGLTRGPKGKGKVVVH